jgi:hypothetical protein
MFKKILISGLLLLSCLAVTAQYKPMLFGLRAGGSIDWMKPDAEQYSNEGIRMGFSWGFIADFYVMENYSVLTGFNVQYLYGKLRFPHTEIIEGDTLSGNLTRKYNLQYIQVPIAFKMQAEVSEKLRLFGKIGLGTAFRLRAKAEDEFTPEGSGPIESKKDISEEIALIRESFLIGGGASITLSGSTALLLELTFDNGFVDILKGQNSMNPEIKQKSVLNLVELGVGIVF